LLILYFYGYTFFHVALCDQFFGDDDAFAVADVSQFYSNHVKTKLQQIAAQISAIRF
jgi:hypothetical protein